MGLLQIKNIPLLFTPSEEIKNFTVNSIVVNNGKLTNFYNSGNRYSVVLNVDEDGDYTVEVPANEFIDLAGNFNLATEQFKFKHDSTPPIMTITSNMVENNGKTNKSEIELTFESSESTNNFDSNDIFLDGAEILKFSGSDTTYKATIKTEIEGFYQIYIDSGKFTDAGGKGNTRSETFKWEYDITGPTIFLSSDTVKNNSTSNDEFIIINISSNEKIIDHENFLKNNNGFLSDLKKIDDNNFKVKFTPKENKKYNIRQ